MGEGERLARGRVTVPAVTQHESFCLYPYTKDSRDARPATCWACREAWDRRHAGRDRDLSCWGLERGSAANGIANLIWLAVLLGAIIWTIVANV
jgi:hypothetical protein